MILNNKTFCLLGIGGIGMSSIAKYLKLKGSDVYGYDREKNNMTKSLEKIGVQIIYDDLIYINNKKLTCTNTIIIYSSAIPESNKMLMFYKKNGNIIKKRAVFLSEICNDICTIAIAGTHGKTTTSAILSHMFLYDKKKITAFIGGVLRNYESNLILKGNDFCIVEADEFDRSFLYLKPEYGCITSIDKDHLDIYESEKELVKTYKKFSRLIKNKTVLEDKIPFQGLKYGINSNCDYNISNIKSSKKGFVFDLKTPTKIYKSIFFNQIGNHNLSNALCAITLADQIGLNMKNILKSLSSFSGVNRRMRIFKFKSKLIIDDYAHHPTEIKFVFETIQSTYFNKENCVFFQPHLYSRTKFLIEEFAHELSRFDNIYLLDIYPAREKKINGISSKLLLSKINNSSKELIRKNQIKDIIKKSNAKVFALLGAGDIGVEVNKVLLQ
ncbi:MAG: UDP-N-acetylmuramate--L-alanine ligase [Flavobacteriaceae bacterium]|nr:UDP-N-acetylmuramate--L-alanine ligase [Flavobacteriaceae bacterium]|tara:strand:- start:18607 stop:19929 length:1323 start_codon:yes stop_codon:yes gene_type:complete